MSNSQVSAARFEAHRPHLLAVATRLLGSAAEAEDAVQEAWFRLDRTDEGGIDNLAGWLTTVVSRICLDHLRTRTSRGEEPVVSEMPEPLDQESGPEDLAILTESTAEALALVLDALPPVERVAFVLHDVFDVPFEQIGGIVDRSPVAARQLASRGRRRARSASQGDRATNVLRQREVVEAFFRASRSGDFQALLAVLDPEVALRADATALQMGIRTGFLTSELKGAEAVAEQFSGAAKAAQLAMIDGVPGAVWATRGVPRVIFGFTIRDGRVVEIELAADAERLERSVVVILG